MRDNTNPFQQPTAPQKPATPLSNVIAGIVTFFATPLIQSASLEPFRDFTVDQYGYDFEWIVDPATWVGSAALTFFGVRAMVPSVLKVVDFRWLDRFLR
ncbi:hypothetical protein QO010_003355 [Caulobacter ginsengisoli]|uniref:Uncharacterized protein n=1 Tax=Caulobacter ginsengisoli TaxID=400775 RepID=A0ABU0IU83_9CAUL|nr:hypothetical protein [Caulobacter ginsengisoli]MDQ0465566.1 hypothetical protein [Caulobacter ginsengisoli]